MPSSKVTGVIVSHVWDDDSAEEIEVRMASLDSSGPCVTVGSEGQMLYFHPDSWPEIRDQVQAMLDDIVEAQDDH